MAANIGDNWGVYELNASEFLPLSKQLEQNVKDLEAQQLILQAQDRKHRLLDSGLGFTSEATIIANSDAESDDFGDDFELPSAPNEAKAEFALQHSTTNVSDASATRQQCVSHLLEGTVRVPLGGAVLTQVRQPCSEHQPANKTEENEPYFPLAMDVDASTTEEDGKVTKEKESELPDFNLQQEDGSEPAEIVFKQSLHVESIIQASINEAEDTAVKEKESEVSNFNPQQEDGSEQLDIMMEEDPCVKAIIHADPQHHGSAEGLKAGAPDTPDAVMLLPADNQKAIETVPSVETFADPSRHNMAIGIAEEMNPANPAKVGDNMVYELTASEFLPQSKQLEQNLKSLEAQRLICDAQHRKQYLLDSGLGFSSEATVIANAEAESDDFGDNFELPSAPSEAVVEFTLQQSTANVSDVSATRQQCVSHLLEGTVHAPPGGSLLAQVFAPLRVLRRLRVHGPPSEPQPATKTEGNEPDTPTAIEVDTPTTDADGSPTKEKGLDLPDFNSQQEYTFEQLKGRAIADESCAVAVIHADPQPHGNAKDLKAGTLHTPDAVLLPADDRIATEAIPSVETVAKLNEQDEIDAPVTVADDSTIEEESELPNLNLRQIDGSGQLNITIDEPHAHVEPSIHADPHQHGSAKDLKAGMLDTPDAVVVLLPDDQNTTEAIPSVETVATLSEHDKAVAIAEKMNPANWPLAADMQACIEELKDPTKPPDTDNNCCLPCSIPCKDKTCNCKLGYTCDKKKCNTLCKGAKSVLQWWTDGFTPRWKLLFMLCKIVLYAILLVAVTVKFIITFSQRESIVFDSITFALSLLGFTVSFVYAVVFCFRRHREIWHTLCEIFLWIVLKVGKYCCCCKKFRCLEKLKKKEESSCKHTAAEKYVKEIEKFKPPQTRCQKFSTYIGNTSEILLTIIDDGILTIVFILSLYSFMGKQDFAIFYGSVEVGRIFSFITLVVSTLKLIFIAHGIRIISIAMNVQSLDKKVERDSEAMEVELPNKLIRYFFSFQSRLVSHALLSSLFQLYGIFALSWKIIQDNCNVVAAPSRLVGNGTNGTIIINSSPHPAGAPFTCSIPPLVNGFTIYNILYIAMVPTLLGYTSFFVCNTPWLVEYMQTITMWTYMQIEYMTGFKVREEDKVAAEGEDSNDGQDGRDGKGGVKDAHISPLLQLLRIFCADLLYDVSDEELQEAGAKAEQVRQTVKNDFDTDVKNFGSNNLSRTFIKLGKVMFFVPAAIIGALQVILFIIHLSFLGCGTCSTGSVLAVFSSAVSVDAAVVFTPLVILFVLTSAPGPWIGMFWILVVFGILVTVAAIVAIVVGIVALLVLLYVLAACAGSNPPKRNRAY